jgi:hypothetical protein
MAAERPLPPAPAPGQPCAYGCVSTGWRWTRAGWTRACGSHRGGPTTTQRGDYVPDDATVPRGDGLR